jgi:hypothetical protein
MERKNNKERIQTWQGHVHYLDDAQFNEDQSARLNGLSQRTFDINIRFACDAARDAVRWDWVYAHKRFVRNAKEGDETRGRISGIIKSGTLYKYGNRFVGTSQQLHISRPEADAPHEFEVFDPRDYFSRTSGTTANLDEVLANCYGAMIDPASMKPGSTATKMSAVREGQKVILEIRSPTSLNRYEFDLAQGGNLVSYMGQSDGIKQNLHCAYEQREGAWVPLKWISDYVNDSPSDQQGRHMVARQSLEFVDNTINLPIDEADFTVEALKMNEGELIVDKTHTGTPLVFRYAKGLDWKGFDAGLWDVLTTSRPVANSVASKPAQEPVSMPATHPTRADAPAKSARPLRGLLILVAVATVACAMGVVFLRRRVCGRDRST